MKNEERKTKNRESIFKARSYHFPYGHDHRRRVPLAEADDDPGRSGEPAAPEPRQGVGLRHVARMARRGTGAGSVCRGGNGGVGGGQPRGVGRADGRGRPPDLSRPGGEHQQARLPGSRSCASGRCAGPDLSGRRAQPRRSGVRRSPVRNDGWRAVAGGDPRSDRPVPGDHGWRRVRGPSQPPGSGGGGSDGGRLQGAGSAPVPKGHVGASL